MSTSLDGARGGPPLISRSLRLQQSEKAAKEESRFRRRILISVGFIILNAVGATIAYQIVEGWSLLDSLYMVAITLTTVGFGEVHPLSLAGRILTLGLVVFGVGGALYALAAITEYVAEGHFAAGIRRRRLRRLVSKLSGHYIVCGFGRMGRGIAGELLREGHSVCVVEIDAENCEAAEEMELPVVRGDATDDASLIAAGLPRASGLVTALDSDAENAFVTLTARSLAPEVKIVARAEHDSAIDKLRKVGADYSVTPYSAGAQQMTLLLTRPLVAQVIAMLSDELHGDIVLRQVELTAQSPIKGKALRHCKDEHLAVDVLALRRGDDVRFMPGRDVKLLEGDQLVAVGSPGDLDNFAGRAAGGGKLNRPIRTSLD